MITGLSSDRSAPRIAQRLGGSTRAASTLPNSGARRASSTGARSYRASGAMRLAAPATSAQPPAPNPEPPVSTSAPDLVPQCTSASRSDSLMSSMRATNGWMPTAANQAGCVSHPRAASAARTASGVCAASAVIFMERLPQGLYDAQTGRPPRWEETSDHSHHDAECDTEQQQEGGYAEAKGNLAEARPVGRTRHDAVDGECE